MATTARGILTPDAGGGYNYTVDMAAMATSIDNMPTAQIYQYRPANLAARNALTGMRAGDLAYQVDTDITYRYVGAAWTTWNIPWTAYTPVLTCGTTNPTGQTCTGRYAQQGKIVTAHFEITMGGTPGSGTPYLISLPVTAILSGRTIGTSRLYDSSTGNYVIGVAEINTTTAVLLQFGLTYLGSLINAAATQPWTWATNDLIDGYIIYEAA